MWLCCLYFPFPVITQPLPQSVLLGEGVGNRGEGPRRHAQSFSACSHVCCLLVSPGHPCLVAHDRRGRQCGKGQRSGLEVRISNLGLMGHLRF